MDWPRSPVASFFMYRRYCSGTLLSRPRSFSILALTSGVTCSPWPILSWTGSAGMTWLTANRTNVTPSRITGSTASRRHRNDEDKGRPNPSAQSHSCGDANRGTTIHEEAVVLCGAYLLQPLQVCPCGPPAGQPVATDGADFSVDQQIRCLLGKRDALGRVRIGGDHLIDERFHLVAAHGVPVVRGIRHPVLTEPVPEVLACRHATRRRGKQQIPVVAGERARGGVLAQALKIDLVAHPGKPGLKGGRPVAVVRTLV